MPVTRKQVAEYASVSEATVSYVVNNGPRPVAPETRERVLEAIRVLGYYPSDVARSLRAQRTFSIGLVIPNTVNPFYGELAQVIENSSYARGYTLMLCNSSMSETRERDYVAALRSKRVAGVIMIPTSAATQSPEQLRDANIPAVILEYVIDGFDSIVVDEFNGGLLLTHHLLELGHRSIGFLTQADDSSSSKGRLEGFHAAHAQAGWSADARLIKHIEQDIDASERAAFELLDQPNCPTAILVHNDTLALGALSAIRKHGLRTPEDISVAGYDDIIESAYFSPPLTTIAYPKRQMAEEAVSLLFNRIQQKQPSEPQTHVLPVTLVKRESTAPPRRA